MKTTILTICQGEYHHGVAAMANSAIQSGFRGTIRVAHQGSIPPWTETLTRVGDQVFEVQGCRLEFRPLRGDRFCGYQKPRVALDVFCEDPECERVIFVDADLFFLAPWEFFDDWTSRGVAYVLDSDFAYLPPSHPWRHHWAELLKQATGREAMPMTVYPNAGFLSVRRSDQRILQDWLAVTDAYAANGGLVTATQQKKRYLPVVGDQDLLAAALMGWDGAVSVIGAEGMGFTGNHFLISHDIDRVKAWSLNFLKEALEGKRPLRAAGYYLRFAEGPIQSLSPKELKMKRVNYRLATWLAQLWKR